MTGENNVDSAITNETALTDFHGQRVLVLGLGMSGLAMVRYLQALGAILTVVDTREQPPALDALRELYPQVGFESIALSEVSLDKIDLIAWSPGISIETGSGGALYQKARQAGVRVVGELDLFVWAVGMPSNIIAVTGTNGKTTVTELVALLAQRSGVQTCAAGNIGPAMLDAWCDARDAGQMPALWVLELSSFQLAISELAGNGKFQPSASVLLNISQDHLDWHESFDTYSEAKQRIAGSTTAAFGLRAQVQTQSTAATNQQTFGADEPQQIGDLGLVREGGITWLAWAVPGEAPIPGKRKRETVAPLVRRLMPADALHIRGEHNHLNALAALGLCHAVGIDMAKMLHGLRDYRAPANRCQLIGVLDGVEYYNDSKGTNVGATVAALQGLGKASWLIAGGQGKSQDFAPLRKAVGHHAAGVVLFGEDAATIASAMGAIDVPVLTASDLTSAVELASQNAGSGQAVLLSPACASFDMFESYVHRGRKFNEIVQAMALDKGVELPC